MRAPKGSHRTTDPVVVREVKALHQYIDALAELKEDAAIAAIHLLVTRVLEAAEERYYNEQWKQLAVALEEHRPVPASALALLQPVRGAKKGGRA